MYKWRLRMYISMRSVPFENRGNNGNGSSSTLFVQILGEVALYKFKRTYSVSLRWILFINKKISEVYGILEGLCHREVERFLGTQLIVLKYYYAMIWIPYSNDTKIQMYANIIRELSTGLVITSRKSKCSQFLKLRDEKL